MNLESVTLYALSILCLHGKVMKVRSVTFCEAYIKHLTKLAIVHDYKHHQMFYIALQPCQSW